MKRDNDFILCLDQLLVVSVVYPQSNLFRSSILVYLSRLPSLPSHRHIYTIIKCSVGVKSKCWRLAWLFMYERSSCCAAKTARNVNLYRSHVHKAYEHQNPSREAEPNVRGIWARIRYYSKGIVVRQTQRGEHCARTAKAKILTSAISNRALVAAALWLLFWFLWL